MPTLRTVQQGEPEYQRALDLGRANHLNCRRCQAPLWFDREETDTWNVEQDKQWFLDWAAREGCPRCDPDGHVLEKQHDHLILDIGERTWPGERIQLDWQVVPRPLDLQRGLASRLNGVVRVEWDGGDASQRGSARRYLVRVQPQVGDENVLPAIIETLNEASRKGNTQFTVDLILQAEDGSELRRGKALV